MSVLLSKPIISLNEARGVLGQEAKSMTDAEVLELIEKLDNLATGIIRNIKVLKPSV